MTRAEAALIGSKVASEISKYKIGKNQYDLSGEYGICFLENNKTFIFDKEDYDTIKFYTWRANEKRNGYVIANGRELTGNKGGTVQLARIIMGLQIGDNRKVDHINHNIYDNRKHNLRICSNMNNSWNSTIPMTNTSGHKGIHKSKNRPRYEAYVGKDGKRYRKIFNFNKYGNEEIAYIEACKWVEEKSKELHGEYCYYRTMKGDESNE